MVVVEGTAGIGKTALLRRSVRDASDVTVVWASGEETEAALEFGVAAQVIAGLPGSPGCLEGGDGFSVGAAVLAGVSALEQRGPVVLVVDDLQWADAASARALLFFLRRLRADRVLVALATHPGELVRLGEGWTRLLADAEWVRWIRLEGLTSAQVRELAAAGGWPLTREVAVGLQEHTDGNPLYVTACWPRAPAVPSSREGWRSCRRRTPTPRRWCPGWPGRPRRRARWCARWRW